MGYITFTSDVTEGAVPLTVNFATIGLQGDPISAKWNFGDGETSSEIFPTHIYTVAGKFSVTVEAEYVWFFDGKIYTASSSAEDYIDAQEYGTSYANIDPRNCTVSYRYGVNVRQGIDFSKNTGAAWPVVCAGVCSDIVVDELGHTRALILDSKDFTEWEITTRDGHTGSGLAKQWTDKSTNVSSDNGTAIAPLIRFKEDTGEKEHFTIEHLMTHVYLRPISESEGFPSGLQVDALMYVDGQQTSESTSSAIRSDVNIPNVEYTFDRRRQGKRIAIELAFNKGKFLLVERNTNLLVKDVPPNPTSRRSNETTNQLTLQSALRAWLTRGPNLLFDQVRKTTVAGSATAIAGPDGISNSAMTIDSPLDLGLTVNGTYTVFAWRKTGQDITGPSGPFDVLTSGDWILSYWAGAPPSFIETTFVLDAGDWADIRVYSTLAVTSGTYLANDTVYNRGRNVMPLF